MESLKNYSEWTCILSNECLTVLKLSLLDIPQIIISFKVCPNLTCEIYSCNARIDVNRIGLKFQKIENKYHIDILLETCHKYTIHDKNNDDKFSTAIKLLTEWCQELDEEKQPLLDILIEQIKLINRPKERYRFSSSLLQLSFKIFF